MSLRWTLKFPCLGIIQRIHRVCKSCLIRWKGHMRYGRWGWNICLDTGMVHSTVCVRKCRDDQWNSMYRVEKIGWSGKRNGQKKGRMICVPWDTSRTNSQLHMVHLQSFHPPKKKLFFRFSYKIYLGVYLLLFYQRANSNLQGKKWLF